MLTDIITKSGELRIIPLKNEDEIDGNLIIDFIALLLKVKENWWIRENWSGGGYSPVR